MTAPKRVQKSHTAPKAPEPETQEVTTDSKDALKAELDELLDEVDEALGENVAHAQEFIDSNIQKGGQ